MYHYPTPRRHASLWRFETCLDALFLFLPECDEIRGIQFPPPMEKQKTGSNGEGTSSFVRAHACKMSTWSVNMYTKPCVCLGQSCGNLKGRETGLFEPVDHLSSCRCDRGEVEYCESFQGRALGCCATMHRLNWGENGVRV